MTSSADLTVTVGWMRDGSALFLAELDALSDAELAEQSALPGWRRAHVAAHVARNADALGRLLSWAHTGVEQRMYPSRESRDADIEASADAAPDQLRDDVRAATAELQLAVDELPPERWLERVQTSRGGVVEAAQVPWMRAREVWIHAVDLNGGATFADFPAEMCELLVEDVAGGLASAPERLSLRLVCADTGRDWVIGEGARTVEAPAAELASWLTGRSQRDDVQLPRWL